MTSRLILVRHGNTFRPDETPVMAGARTDLPLVEKGLAQADAVGDALAAIGFQPQSILTGPLQRTLQTARIIAEKLARGEDSVAIDPRLREIDYGTWEAKTNDEVIALGGGQELEAWNKRSVFPATPGWQPIEAQIGADVRMVLETVAEGENLIITSNGILRYFAAACANLAAIADRKVGTGNLCVLTHDGDGWRIAGWNLKPGDLAGQIAA